MAQRLRKGMKQLLETLKSSVFFKRMLLMYLLCTNLVFIGFVFLMSALIQKNYISHVEQINEKALLQSANTCSVTLENLYNYFYVEILDNPDLIGILLADEFSPELSVSFSRLNGSLINYSSLVDSCYLINRKGNFVCSTLSTYRDIRDFFDQDILGWISLFEESGQSFHYVPRETDYRIGSVDYTRRYITLMFQIFPQSWLVVNVDSGRFSEMVNYSSYNPTSRTFLTGADGYVLADSGGNLFGRQISDKEVYRKLAGRDADRGSFFIKPEGYKKLVNYRKNELFGISYFTVTDYRILDYNNTLLLKAILYSLPAVLINLFLIVGGSWVLYKPIKRLRGAISDKQEGPDSRVDEFAVIERAFYNMKIAAEEKLYSRQERLLQELLNDRASSGDMAGCLKEAHLVFNRPRFAAGILEITPVSGKTEEDGLIIFAAENIFRELLGQWCDMRLVQDSGRLACIFNYDQPQADPGGPCMNSEAETGWKEEIRWAAHELSVKMKEFYHVGTHLSMGEAVSSIYDISESYQEAAEAGFYRKDEESAASFFGSCPISPPQDQHYPAEQAKNLLEALKGRDEGRLLKAVAEFFGEIQSYSRGRIFMCLSILNLDLERLEDKYGIGRHESEIVPGPFQEESLYLIERRYQERCRKLFYAGKESKDHSSARQEIIQAVYDIVEREITNPDLSIHSLAAEIHLSTGYLRNLFKEASGSTVSNYIIEKRLEQICRLLRDTDLSVSQIADRLGFSSKNYVFTFFKNYMGMTPNQYRKQETENE